MLVCMSIYVEMYTHMCAHDWTWKINHMCVNYVCNFVDVSTLNFVLLIPIDYIIMDILNFIINFFSIVILHCFLANWVFVTSLFTDKICTYIVPGEIIDTSVRWPVSSVRVVLIISNLLVPARSLGDYHWSATSAAFKSIFSK